MTHFLSLQSPHKIPFILPLCMLITTLGGLLLTAELFQNAITAWLSLIYFGVLCWIVMRYYPAAFILLLWFIFLRATTMISGAAIESGGFMKEILLQGEATGAFARLAVTYTIGILGGIFMLDRFLKLLPAPNTAETNATISTWAYGAFALVAFVCAGIVMIGFEHGFPLIEGIDRFTYWKSVSSRFLDAFLSNRIIFAVLLGMVFAACQGAKKTAAAIIFAGLMIVSVLMAEKFTSISLMLIYFITPLFLMRPNYLAQMPRYVIMLGIAISVITIPAVLLVYGINKDPQTALEKFQSRAASQAQIWYIADQEEDALFKLDLNRIEHNIAAIKSTNPDALRQNPPYIGARDFMAQYLDKGRYANYLDKGISLTLAMEGYLMKLFGYLGMLPVYLFILGIYAAQLAYLGYGITSANPVRVILAAKLLVWSDYGLKQGYLYSILGIKSIVFMLAIIGFEIMIRLVIKRKDRPQDRGQTP